MSLRISPVSAAYRSGADLSAKKYCFVKLDTTTDNTVLLAGAGEAVLGVLLNSPTATQFADVAESGHTYIKLGGTVAIGDKIKSDANGKGVVAVATDKFYLIAIEAGVAGDEVECKIQDGVA